MKIKNSPNLVLKRLEFKATAVAKDASGDCIIEGYANTSTKDRVGDVVLPKAFEKSLPTFLKNPILLANHDWNDPCGKILHAEITDKGLYVKARISDTRPDIKTLINEGCLSTFSIGYNEVDADFDEQTKTKYVKELELLEISVVTVPANTEASFTIATQKAEETVDEAKAEEAKSAPAPRTAKDLSIFISDVKNVVDRELTGTEISAICDYFNNPEEEIMTRKQLIDLLKGKKDASQAAAAPAAASADAAKADAPAESQEKPADADMMKQVLAKLDQIGQALAQLMEGQKPAESEEGKADDQPKEEQDKKPEEEKKPEEGSQDEEEMSDEDCEKAIAELQAEISAIEDKDDL